MENFLEELNLQREATKRNIEKAFGNDIEKARSGVYADTAENRKLQRVGQHYGGHKQEQPTAGQPRAKKQEEQPKSGSKQKPDAGSKADIYSKMSQDEKIQVGSVLGKLMNILGADKYKKEIDPNKIKLTKTDDGNWKIEHNGNSISTISTSSISEDTAKKIGWLKDDGSSKSDDGGENKSKDVDKNNKNRNLLRGVDNEILSKMSVEQKNKLKRFIQKNELTFNEETGCYDSDKDVVFPPIRDSKTAMNFGIIKGKFAMKFGIIKGKFDCSRCDNLKSLEGAPKHVGGNFDCEFTSIKSLVGSPEYVGGDFRCNEIKKLDGAPKYVGGDFNCSDSHIKSLVGSPEYVGGDFNCDSLDSESFNGAPKHIGGDFVCYINGLGWNNKRENFKDLPQNVGGEIDIYDAIDE